MMELVSSPPRKLNGLSTPTGCNASAAGPGGLADSSLPPVAQADLAAASQARRRGDIGWIMTHVHYPNIGGYCSSMMDYCCADGRVGLRSDLQGH